MEEEEEGAPAVAVEPPAVEEGGLAGVALAPEEVAEAEAVAEEEEAAVEEEEGDAALEAVGCAVGGFVGGAFDVDVTEVVAAEDLEASTAAVDSDPSAGLDAGDDAGMDAATGLEDADLDAELEAELDSF